jgi:hypothetical protein
VQNPSYDLFLEGRPPLRELSPKAPLQVGDLLFEDRWKVEQVVPTTQGPSDYEVYAKRIRLHYFVVEEGSRRLIGSHTADHRLMPGEVITVGVDRWRISAIDDRVFFELMDAVAIAAQP